MADGSCVEAEGCVREGDSSLVNNDNVIVCDLKTMCESVSKTSRVKMSFYVENNSEKSEEPSVPDSISAKSSIADKSKHVETPSGKNDDGRKKRCTDRYDSSESSDSGVAVLSICGSSSSDITEPGSPYSPASCTSSGSGSEGAPGEGVRPPWPWVPTVSSSPNPNSSRAKRPRADKCTNLESLITKKLHKNAAMPTNPEPAANYNNNLLISTEEKKSNKQTSQHCCIQRSEEVSGMPATKVLSQSIQTNDSLSQISSIPKHIIHKVVPQPPVCRSSILDRSSESKLKEDKVNQLKIQQGRITEYYKSQMKPSNGLKRDYEALISRAAEAKGKSPTGLGLTKAVANECSENLGNYLSYLSQTFNSKMHFSNKTLQKATESASAPKPPSPASQHSQNNVLPVQDIEKKPIPALNPILNSKNISLSSITQKTETFRCTAGIDVQNKTLKEGKSSVVTAGSKNGKRTKTIDGKNSIAAKISKGHQTSPLTNMDSNTKSLSSNESNVKNKSLNGVQESNRQISLSAIHDHMRQVLESPTLEGKKRPWKTKRPRSFNRARASERVPSIENNQNLTSNSNILSEVTNSNINNIITNSADLQSANNNLVTASSAPSLQVSSANTSVHTSTLINNSNSTQEFQSNKQLINQVSSNTSSVPSVTVSPPTVMLTAIRIPQPCMQQTPLVNSDNARPPSHIAISPTKINGQFVLPMVQNINGALVQIPSLVTKVGQNTVLPINSQNLIQRSENIVNHQTTQMYINGTLLKVNGPMHHNLSGLIAKQMTATSTTNVSYAVTQKTLTSAVPTVMSPKPNFTINHSIFASTPGFILNPMAGVVTAQSNTNNTIPTQQQFGGNVVLTTSLHPAMHVSPSINNNLTGISVPTGSIPISPIKLGDINRVFLTPTRPIIPKMTITSEQTPCSTVTSNFSSAIRTMPQVPVSKTVVLNEQNQPSDKNLIPSPISAKPNVETTPPCLPEKSNENNSKVERNRDVEKVNNSDIVEKFKPSDVPEPNLNSNSKASDISNLDNGLLMSEETKESVHSVSDDLNCTSSSNSTESLVTELSKDIDEDSILTNQTTNDSFNNCAKTPLLTYPNVIRFPLKASESKSKNNARNDLEENKICRWNGCGQNVDDSCSLLEHLQVCHVNTQAGKETYTCLWQGCKVYNRPSCSKCWLERHVLSHGGTKLFRCIVDGCGQRFNTQLVLQRHVNSHFTDNGNSNASVKKTVEAPNAPPKLIRRNGKKLRYRRQPWSARIFDFFDAGIMEGLQYRVVRTAAWRTGEAAGCKPSLYKERSATSITLAATILAKRLHETNQYYECLVTWRPANVLQDEWLPEKDFVPYKDVTIGSLGASSRAVLYSGFCSSYRQPPTVTFSTKESLDLTYYYNKTKTDSLVTDTANETPLYANKHTVNKVESEKPKLSGAARRKQWRR